MTVTYISALLPGRLCHGLVGHVLHCKTRQTAWSGAVSCSGMEWGGGGGGEGEWGGEREGRDMLQHTIHWPAAASCSGMEWSGGWGGGWRVRDMLQLQVALQKILPAAVSCSGMAWRGGGVGGKRHAATQGGLTKDPPSCSVMSCGTTLYLGKAGLMHSEWLWLWKTPATVTNN